MLPPLSSHTWRHVPGYDSDSDSEFIRSNWSEEDEEEDPQGLQERLDLILQVLSESERWQEAPLVDFAPVGCSKSKDKDKDRRNPSLAERLRCRTNQAPPPLPPQLMQRSGPGPTFRLEHVRAPIVRETCLYNGLVPVASNEFCVMWSGPGLKEHNYKDLHEYQRVNHFPGGFNLTRKDTMYENLVKMAGDFGTDTYDFIPDTFCLPEQAEAFLSTYRRSGGLWIYKPSNAACGRGIFIFRNITRAQLSLKDSAVISRYLENPLLIHGLKFDLRVYVTVTQYEPLRAYIYREGLARFASAPYSTEDEHLSDPFRQLTNYSINKYAPNFSENADIRNDNYGHKWSFSALNKHLKCVGVDVDIMWSRIMDLIVKTLLAVEPVIAAKTRQAIYYPGVCFEVYGFDILVDDELKPWILEVNLSPSMQAESPLDWQVKSSLLCDSFNLVGVCSPDTRMVRSSKGRAQIMQSRINHRKLMQERATFAGIGGDEDDEEKDPKEVQRRKALVEKALRGGIKSLIPANPVQLARLGETQLKMLARSLQEFMRSHNFIRLYPTRKTVERYAPITLTRGRGPRNPSHMLAAILYGPTPIISEAEEQKKKALAEAMERLALQKAEQKAALAAAVALAARAQPAAAPLSPKACLPAAIPEAAPVEEADSSPRQPAVQAAPRRLSAAQIQEFSAGPRSCAAGGAEVEEEEEEPQERQRQRPRSAVQRGTKPSEERGLRVRVTRTSTWTQGDAKDVCPGSQQKDLVARDSVASVEKQDKRNHEGNDDGDEEEDEGEDEADEADAEQEDDQKDRTKPAEAPAAEAEDLPASPAAAAASDQRPASAASHHSTLSLESGESCDPEEGEPDRKSALDALRGLGPSDCWRLALMEYLLRVSRVCSVLTSKEKAALAQSSFYALLSAFSRKVRSLRASWREQRTPARSPSLTSSSDDDSDLDFGDLMEELAAVARGAVRSLATAVWTLDEDLSPSSSPKPSLMRRLDRRTRELAKHLPLAFLKQGGTGRKAAESIHVLKASDLEEILQTPKLIQDFQPLANLFSSAEESRHRRRAPADGQQFLTNSAWSPVAALLQVRTPPPRRQLRRGKDATAPVAGPAVDSSLPPLFQKAPLAVLEAEKDVVSPISPSPRRQMAHSASWSTPGRGASERGLASPASASRFHHGSSPERPGSSGRLSATTPAAGFSDVAMTTSPLSSTVRSWRQVKQSRSWAGL